MLGEYEILMKEINRLRAMVHKAQCCCENIEIPEIPEIPQEISVVNELPETGEENVLYIVLSEGNFYVSYVWNGSQFVTENEDQQTYPGNIVQQLADSNETNVMGSYIDLETGNGGRAYLVFTSGYADFLFDSDGVVTLLQYSSNVFTSLQTGTNHVIIKDNGPNVRLVNEMGSAQSFNLIIQYL